MIGVFLKPAAPTRAVTADDGEKCLDLRGLGGRISRTSPPNYLQGVCISRSIKNVINSKKS